MESAPSEDVREMTQAEVVMQSKLMDWKIPEERALKYADKLIQVCSTD